AFQSGDVVMNPKPNGAPSDPDQGYQSAQRHRTFFVSEGVATKLSACTSGFTIQAFVRPWFPFQGNDRTGNMIVGLSNSEGMSSVANPNFGLFQTGDSGAEAATLMVRTGASTASSQSSVTGAYTSVRQGEAPGRYSELIATQEPSGVLTVYVNRIPRSSVQSVRPSFAPNAKLVVGNELVPLTVANGQTNVDQQRNWSGEIRHLAIYCRGFTRAEIVGALEESKIKAEVVNPSNSPISSARQDARRMIERLSGSLVPIDHPMVARVEEKLLRNDRVGAAKTLLATMRPANRGILDF
ncbi:MAG TPA: hypothetical protein VM432_08625, partial [Bdellovibrionales bacterium]|nr:hypothetical protein [Bdellovibrionales bacterium]